MAREERRELLSAMPLIESHWRDLENGMVALKARPCPYFAFNRCTVYAVRPYNCRRFACLRPDPKTEPLELNHGPTGSVNGDARFYHSRPMRRLLVQIQRKAQRWASKHGWVDTPGEKDVMT